MSQQSESFSIRIVKVDHYMAAPVKGLDEVYSTFKNMSLTKVPVIRIFGITGEGKKGCAHVHGVFPYIYVPFDGNATPSFLYDFAIALDRGLAINPSNNNSDTFVYKIEVCYGVPFYGYHQESRQFLKIYFINPRTIERAAEVLQSGTIMNSFFQPHEAHLSYILRMFIDNNLYGMNFAKFIRSDVFFRNEPRSSTNSNMTQTDELISLRKQSTCEVEVDVSINSFINNLSCSDESLNPGIAAIWEDARQRRRYMMETSQLTPVCSQERRLFCPTESEMRYLNQIKEKVQDLNDSDIFSSKTDGCDDSTINEGNFDRISQNQTPGFSQISWNQADLELCDIMNELMNSDSPLKDADEKHHLELISDIDDICIEAQDELLMSQIINCQNGSDDEADSSIGGSSIDLFPQVDGPIGSPILENESSLADLLENYCEFGSKRRCKTTAVCDENSLDPMSNECGLLENTVQENEEDTTPSTENKPENDILPEPSSPRSKNFEESESSVNFESSEKSFDPMPNECAMEGMEEGTISTEKNYSESGMLSESSLRARDLEESESSLNFLSSENIKLPPAVQIINLVNEECGQSDDSVSKELSSEEMDFTLMLSPSTISMSSEREYSFDNNTCCQEIEINGSKVKIRDCGLSEANLTKLGRELLVLQKLKMELCNESQIATENNVEEASPIVAENNVEKVSPVVAENNVEEVSPVVAENNVEEVSPVVAENCQIEENPMRACKRFRTNYADYFQSYEEQFKIMINELESRQLSSSVGRVNKAKFGSQKWACAMKLFSPFVVVERLDKAVEQFYVDQWYGGLDKEEYRLKRKTATRNETRSSSVRHKHRLPNGYVGFGNNSCRPSPQLKEKMMAILGHQQQTQLVSSGRLANAPSSNVDYPQISIPEADDDTCLNFNDAMWGMSLLSPRESSPVENAADSLAVGCTSPTSFNRVDADSQLFGDNLYSGNSSNNIFNGNAKSILKKPPVQRPPRPKAKVLKNVREDRNAVKALLTSYEDNSVNTKRKTSTAQALISEGSMHFPVVAANETVSDSMTRPNGCFRVNGLSTQQSQPVKKGRGRPRKDPNAEPKSPIKKPPSSKKTEKPFKSGEKVFKKRGRPRKYSLENILGADYYNKVVASQSETNSNYSNSVASTNAQINSSYYHGESFPDELSSGETNGPAVIVEPVDNLLNYSHTLLNIFEDEEMTNFGVSSNDNWMSQVSSGAVETSDSSNNRFCETYMNYASAIASETHDNAVYAKENNLMTTIEQIVNDMDIDQFNVNCGMSNDLLENASLEMRSSEDGGAVFNSEQGDAIVEMMESQTMCDLMVLPASQANTFSHPGNENEPPLSQTVDSFYDFETFSSTADWVNNVTVDNSAINTSANIDNPVVNISVVEDSNAGNSAMQYTSSDGLVYTPVILPPSQNAILESLAAYGIPHERHEQVHFSNAKDAPGKAVKLGGGAVVLNVKCQSDFEELAGVLSETGVNHWKSVFSIAEESGQGCFSNCDAVPNNSEPELFNGMLVEPSIIPPSCENVRDWLNNYVATELSDNQAVASGEKVENQSMPFISPICPSPPLSRNSSPSFEPCNSQVESVIESTPVSSAKPAMLLRNTMKRRRRLSLNPSPICLPVESDPKTPKETDLLIKQVDSIKDRRQGSQIDGPTPKNKFGFKLSEQSLSNSNEGSHLYQHLTTLSMEVFADSTNFRLSDPKLNEIRAIFYHIHVDCESAENSVTGFICTSQSENGCTAEFLLSGNVKRTVVGTELEIITSLLSLIENYDPDIFLGYEIEANSWGFLLERASVLGLELWSELSRVPDDRANIFKAYDGNTDFYLNIVGRIVLAVGSLMKSELALYNYTFENVAYHVLHKRIPLFPISTLRDWFNHPTSRWRAIQHFLLRTKGNFELLDKLNLIGRTSELARLFGIQFQEVLTRGTQFRVESMMLRLCKSLKYIAVSPSVSQRATMRAPEHLPLILEPRSKFFTDPVVVLDFQSLYPSIIIAYNYCFSTCFGRVEHLGEDKSFPFGCTILNIPQNVLKDLRDQITVSPCGVAFAKSNVRKGVLPKMLEEILAARVMVKMEMKKRKSDHSLKRMLDARQLGLKLIANVTYGYTSANFSGRMPCVEIADSVVSKSRETLERAIKLVENTSRWGAQVVYGDTDSMFVLLEGRTKQQAFEIGKEIADAVTADNPKPIKLKLEKVYLPCLLETKKRYVGFMYETPETVEPVYDAKGIETVRRDGCPAVAKILEKSLKTLFRTKDMSQVKTYVQHQFHKLVVGRCGIDDYVFTRDYRGRSGYRAANHAPALRIARALEREDHRSEPRIGQRVPYVIVYGKPGDILCDLVRHPSQILRDSSLRLNANYYINNVICAALGRAFSLVGIDVRKWYSTLPRSTRFSLQAESSSKQDGNTLSRYLMSTNCPVCDGVTKSGLCSMCCQDPQRSAVVLNDRIREWEKRHSQISTICKSCTGTSENQLSCVSLDCPLLFRLALTARDARQAEFLRQLIANL